MYAGRSTWRSGSTGSTPPAPGLVLVLMVEPCKRNVHCKIVCNWYGLPPAPHPHFRIVEFREPASALTSNRSGYVRTMQIRTVHFRAIISARKSSSAVHFRTRGTLHSRSARGKRSAHFISAVHLYSYLVDEGVYLVFVRDWYEWQSH